MFGRKKHGFDIDFHDPLPIVDVFLHDAALAVHADVVVEAVDPPPGVERARDHAPAGVGLGHVGGVREGGAPVVGDHLRGARGEGHVAVDDEHACAGARQQERRRAAVADPLAGGAAAGDDGHLAGEAPLVVARCIGHGRLLLAA